MPVFPLDAACRPPLGTMAIIPLLASATAGLAVFGYLLTKFYPWIKYDLQYMRALIRAAVTLKRLEYGNKLLGDLFEEKADVSPKKTCLIFNDRCYSYEFADRQMNRVAHAALALGVQKGDVVAMFLPNGPDFIWTAYGLYKIGAQPAFINYNLRSKSLLHCINACEAKTLLVGHDDELVDAVVEIYPELRNQGVKVHVTGMKRSLPEGFSSLDDVMSKASEHRPDKKCRSGIDFNSTLCFIFTSGTTGLPKAAVISHSRALKGAVLLNMINVNKDDIIYTALPLYHSAAGLIALGATVFNGATLVLRSKFSASHFIEDCRKHKVTVIQYIGELCRYLCATPKSPDDKNHCIRAACGNGLRRDIWSEFQNRFGIPFIGEFYAATEGNTGFFNIGGKFGSVGRNSPLLKLLMPVFLIKYDVTTEQPIRGENGYCIEVGVNEPGLMIGQIKANFTFDGYKGSRTLSEKKIIRNVFKKGDIYFNSGDLLEMDSDYFVYFKDRLGDTFRWKGENVSTCEVANVLTDLSWVEDANVYGVEIPGQEGRAGMAALSLTSHFELSSSDLGSIFDQCKSLLPTYAWPRFIRIQRAQNMTSTFKLRKVDLVKEGFDPGNVSPDPVYCLDLKNKSYTPLTDDLYAEIISGKIRL